MRSSRIRIHGQRLVDPKLLSRYPEEMTELDVAAFLDISENHARRHRTVYKVKGSHTWPRHFRLGGQRGAVRYRRAEVRKWVQGLPRVGENDK